MDDTCLMTSSTSTEEVVNHLEQTVSRVVTWCDQNDVKLNASKTQLIMNEFVEDCKLSIQDSSITASQSACYLGATIRNHANLPVFYHDFQALVSSLRKRLNILRCMRLTLTKTELKVFCQGLILGKLAYILPLLGAEHP